MNEFAYPVLRGLKGAPAQGAADDKRPWRGAMQATNKNYPAKPAPGKNKRKKK